MSYKSVKDVVTLLTENGSYMLYTTANNSYTFTYIKNFKTNAAAKRYIPTVIFLRCPVSKCIST